MRLLLHLCIPVSFHHHITTSPIALLLSASACVLEVACGIDRRAI
jgi:hypothetical protein